MLPLLLTARFFVKNGMLCRYFEAYLSSQLDFYHISTDSCYHYSTRYPVFFDMNVTGVRF